MVTLVVLFATVAASPCPGAESPAGEWTKVSDEELGPGFSPGLVWSPEAKRFVLFGGVLGAQHRGERPYDVMSFDPADGKWRNQLPKAAEGRGGETGAVKKVPFKTPWYSFEDAEGLARPNTYHTSWWYQYALAPWDGKVYALICGRVLCYDPNERAWKDMKAPVGPMPQAQSYMDSLSWSALCADPVNRELLLFGGCGVATENGSPGTWVYSPEKNEWRKLELKSEPPPRALSPMAFDPAAKKIVLFGGDGLDRVHADTWLYDCATRTWEEKKPAVGPAPRFGHALLALPKSGRVVLIGGKAYRTTNDYYAMLYRALPFEVWTYDAGRNEWALVQRLEKGGPPQIPNEAACAAASGDDAVVFIGGTPQSYEKGPARSTWLCRPDTSKPDAAGTAQYGVKPGAAELRTGAFDPDWYAKDLPPADPAAGEAALKSLVANTWTALKPPRLIENRQGGAWSTVTLDTDRDQIVHMGGGHSAYFGNDVAHYDIKTGRWSIACRPQFALEFNYSLDGPGPWAFNGAPWGNHNYHAYAYDPTIKRVAYIKEGMTLFYDPAARTWPYAEKFGNLPFSVSKYTNYLVTTPGGVVCWTQAKENRTKNGLWRLEGGKTWKEILTSGEALPAPVCDGSTITYDSKRDRLLLTTTPAKGGEPAGQVWSADLKSGEVKRLSPDGMAAVRCERFARESAYLPKDDLVMIGFLLPGNGGALVPFYDCEKNRWLGAKMPGAEFFSAGKLGMTEDFGLVYDPGRNLVWGVRGILQAAGSLRAAGVDAASLGAQSLK